MTGLTRAAPVLALVMFLIGFLVSRTAVVALTPWEAVDVAGSKLEVYAASSDPYDVVFVGSSRVYRHVVPDVIDSRLEAAGVPGRSFNFGVAGMRALETLETLPLVLGASPQPPKWVVITPELVEPEFDAEATVRGIAWHSFDSTVASLQAVAASDADLSNKLDWALSHLTAFSWNATGVGQYLAAIANTPDANTFEAAGLGGDGWVSLDLFLDLATGRARRNLATRQDRLDEAGAESFAAKVASLSATAEAVYADPPALNAAESSYLESLRKTVEGAGSRLVLMVPPGGDEFTADWLIAAQQQGIVDSLIVLADPRTHPELFDLDLWFDNGHMNERGAVLFSQVLGDELAKLAGGTVGEPPDASELPGSDRIGALIARLDGADGFTERGGGLLTTARRATLPLADIEPDSTGVIAVELGGPSGNMMVTLEGRDGTTWTPATTSTGDLVQASGEAGVVLALAVDENAARFEELRLAFDGHIGLRIDGVAFLGTNADIGSWESFETVVDGTALVKDGGDAWFSPPSGVEAVFVEFAERTGNIGIRLDLVTETGLEVRGPVVRPPARGLQVAAFLPSISTGEIRVSILGPRDTTIARVLIDS